MKIDVAELEWEEANRAWEREWDVSIARLMRIGNLSREEAIEYVELEEVEYNLGEALIENVKTVQVYADGEQRRSTGLGGDA